MFEDSPMTPEQRQAELKDPRHQALLAQLHDDIRIEVARDLPNFRAREAEFAQLDTGELLPIYMNWRYRHVHPHPRTVEFSSELSQRIATNDALYASVKSEFRCTHQNHQDWRRSAVGRIIELRSCQKTIRAEAGLFRSQR